MLISSILILTFNLEKSPIIQYFLGFLFVKILLRENIQWRSVLKYFLIAFIAIIIIYLTILNQPLLQLFNYNSGLIGRIILGQSTGTYLSFDLFPKYHDFIGFDSISNLLSNLLGLDYSERSARLIMEFYNSRGVDEGGAGVINSLFIGEAWANFGLIGVLLSPLYVGFITQFINLFFLKNKKTPILVGILAYLSYNMPITGGVNDFIYNVFLLTIILAFLFLISWTKVLTKAS
ncbi:hypothetical protein GCM10023143_20750 [Compostibacter hankyongensis]|uniref:Oligosaccharide repeat unit polymerase n=1 Tax=Compostibacter hankyongensis TaxID=1007089 RepID=A0ABP8FV54_9BACT